MTPYEHYLRAEDILTKIENDADTRQLLNDYGMTSEAEAEAIVVAMGVAFRAAQVHATLATFVYDEDDERDFPRPQQDTAALIRDAQEAVDRDQAA